MSQSCQKRLVYPVGSLSLPQPLYPEFRITDRAQHTVFILSVQHPRIRSTHHVAIVGQLPMIIQQQTYHLLFRYLLLLASHLAFQNIRIDLSKQIIQRHTFIVVRWFQAGDFFQCVFAPCVPSNITCKRFFFENFKSNSGDCSRDNTATVPVTDLRSNANGTNKPLLTNSSLHLLSPPFFTLRMSCTRLSSKEVPKSKEMGCLSKRSPLEPLYGDHV